MGGTLNYGRNINNQIGTDYTIDDQTKKSSSTSATSTPTLDGMFVVTASRGIPNKFLKNLTKANAYAMFGEFTEKNGMQALACQRHLDLGLTATILRLDDGGKVANYHPKITFGAETATVYLLGGKLYNVTAGQVGDGTFDEVLESLDMTGTEFLADAVSIEIPVLRGTLEDGFIPDVEDEDDLRVKAAALYAETAGVLGIKNRSIVPFVFHSPGAGKYGNKVALNFNNVFSIRNYVQTRTLVVNDAITGKNTTYSAVSLVPDKLDGDGIVMYVGDKLKDKVVINDYLGDLNVRMLTDDTNRDGLVEAFAEYYTALMAALNTLKTTNADELIAGTGGVVGLGDKLQAAIDTYTALLEDVEGGDIHPWQILGWNGKTIYDNAAGFNYIYLGSDVVKASTFLSGGDDGIVKGMRKFSYEYSVDGGTTTLEDLYIKVFRGEVDERILDYGEVESVLTYDLDYTTAIRKQLQVLISHGKNTRGDMTVIGGMNSTIDDLDTAIEFAKATKRYGSKHFGGTENAEIYDTNLSKTYRVNSAFLMIDALAAWFFGDRKNSVSDYGLNPNIREGSLRPKIFKSDDINALYAYDYNTIKKVDGVYRFRSQMLGDYGSTSKMKELSNGINFNFLMKETHFSIDRHSKGTGETSLNTIKEKIARDLVDFGKYFESTPIVTLSYADDDAEARGEADLNVEVAMGGSIKKYNVKFIITNANAA